MQYEQIMMNLNKKKEEERRKAVEEERQRQIEKEKQKQSEQKSKHLARLFQVSIRIRVFESFLNISFES